MKEKAIKKKQKKYKIFLTIIIAILIILFIPGYVLITNKNKENVSIISPSINNISKNIDIEQKMETNLLDKSGIISFRPLDIMKEPMMLMKVWIDEPIPLKFYIESEKKAQIEINNKVADAIWTYYPENQKEFSDNYKLQIEQRNIDNEDITPYNWKWLTFEMNKEDGSKTKIDIRRPHWWIKYYEADKIDNEVWLSLGEMGIEGFAKLTNISPNQLDTRFWDEKRKGDYVLRPITGKFQHESNDVWNYYFSDNEKPIGATSTHPFWSIDRKDWISVGELFIGENVKTYDGKITKLLKKEKLSGKQTVYNLEIYRSHNFFVGDEKILVHNGCEAQKFIYFGKNKVPANDFHRQIKPDILETVGRSTFEKVVGRNPDVKILNNKIVLTGTEKAFKGKSYTTDLLANDFFDF